MKKKRKLKYFLDHPQIKRKKALGNGNTPTSSSTSKPSSSTATSSTKGSKPSLAEQINFGGKFDK